MTDTSKLPTTTEANATFQANNPQYFSRPAPVATTDPKTTSAPPPATTAPPAVVTPYFPRSTTKTNPTTGAITDDKGNITGYDASVNAGKPFGSGPGSSSGTTDSFYETLFNQSRGIIDSINQEYQAKVDAAKLKSSNTSKRINAVAANAGISGSPDAYKGEQSVADQETLDINTASAERNKATSDLLSGLSTEAYKRSQDAKTFDKSTETEQYNRAQTDKSTVLAQAKSTVKNIASSGHSLEDIKTNMPDQYATLLSHYGGDETALNSDYLANVPTASMLNGDKPIATNGSKAVYAIQDPITKKITTMEIDAGVPLDNKDWTQVRVPNMGIFAFNTKTGEGHMVNSETRSQVGTPKISGKLQYTNDEVSSLGTLMRTGGDVGGTSYAPADENGFVDPVLYEEMYNNWLDNGGVPQDYARLYPPKIYVNPADNSKLPSFLQNREKTTASSTDFSSAFGN